MNGPIEAVDYLKQCEDNLIKRIQFLAEQEISLMDIEEEAKAKKAVLVLEANERGPDGKPIYGNAEAREASVNAKFRETTEALALQKVKHAYALNKSLKEQAEIRYRSALALLKALSGGDQ